MELLKTISFRNCFRSDVNHCVSKRLVEHLEPGSTMVLGEELAEQADMDYKYLGAVERRERNITIDNIEKIARGFQVQAYQLFLFSMQGVQPEEAFLEDQVKDLIERCSGKKKTLMLGILRDIARYEDK